MLKAIHENEEEQFEKGIPKFTEQELLKIECGGLPVCVSDERGDQENSFIYETDSGYDLHLSDTFHDGDVSGNSAFVRKHKHLEISDETESPRHVSSSQHSQVLDEDSDYVKDAKRITHDDKIFKLKIYGMYPLLVSETSPEQENVAPIDLEHARRSKMDPVAISILSKETDKSGQVSSWWYSWRNIWCISLLMTILQQVVKQRQSKCRWLLLLLCFLPVITGETSPCVQVQENGTAILEFYYDLNITQHTIEAYLDHRPPNKTNFDPVVVVIIFSENNFTITLNPYGYVLVSLTKKKIIVRIPSVSLKHAGDYRFTAMHPKTTSSTCSLIVTENLADVAQNYKNVITIVAVAALLLLALIIGIVVCFKCPKIYKAAVRLMKGCQCQFNSCCKTTASATENNAQDHIAENQPLQGNNGTD